MPKFKKNPNSPLKYGNKSPFKLRFANPENMSSQLINQLSQAQSAGTLSQKHMNQISQAHSSGTFPRRGTLSDVPRAMQRGVRGQWGQRYSQRPIRRGGFGITSPNVIQAGYRQPRRGGGLLGGLNRNRINQLFLRKYGRVGGRRGAFSTGAISAMRP